jgi:hypothetical protein
MTRLPHPTVLRIVDRQAENGLFVKKKERRRTVVTASKHVIKPPHAVALFEEICRLVHVTTRNSPNGVRAHTRGLVSYIAELFILHVSMMDNSVDDKPVTFPYAAHASLAADTNDCSFSPN